MGDKQQLCVQVRVKCAGKSWCGVQCEGGMKVPIAAERYARPLCTNSVLDWIFSQPNTAQCSGMTGMACQSDSWVMLSGLS